MSRTPTLSSIVAEVRDVRLSAMALDARPVTLATMTAEGRLVRLAGVGPIPWELAQALGIVVIEGVGEMNATLSGERALGTLEIEGVGEVVGVVSSETTAPQWGAGVYYASDGAAYWEGPAIPFGYTALSWSRAFNALSTAVYHFSAMSSATHFVYQVRIRSGTAHQVRSVARNPTVSNAFAGGAAPNDSLSTLLMLDHRTNFLKARMIRPDGTTASAQVNSGALPTGAGTTRIGWHNAASVFGQHTWQVFIASGVVTDADMAVVRNAGVQADPRVLLPGADWIHGWSMAGTRNNGGVIEAYDLVANAWNMTLINGSSANLVAGAW